MTKKKIVIQEPEAWVSIDPGLDGTGLAFWQGDRLIVPDWKGGRSVATIRPKKSAEDWMQKAIQICEDFEGWMDAFVVTKLVIELPFVEVKGKRTLVAAKTGSVVKLSILTGMLIGCAANVLEFHRLREAMKVEWILPSVWKGQLPDKALKNRIEAWARKEKCKLPGRLSEHARDALGLGLSVLGKL